MNVAAEHRLHRVVLGVTDDRRLELAHEINCILNPLLCVSAQRPIPKAEPPPHEIDQRIEAEQKLVAKIAGEGEPPRVLDHRVQLMAMNDEEAPAIAAGGSPVSRSRLAVNRRTGDEIIVIGGM